MLRHKSKLCGELWISALCGCLVALACGSSDDEGLGSIPGPASTLSPAGTGELCANGLDDDGDGEPDCSDPDCLAAVANATQLTAFADTVAWLYTPASAAACAPLQQGVSAGALAPGRVSVVRGRVSDTLGQPLAGAEVRVVGAPELGRTRSRGDGMFDMAVNGGGKVTLQIGGVEYLTVHRRTGVPVNAFAWVEPVALKARSAVATRVELTGGAALQVMRAEASEDASGRREPAVFFPLAPVRWLRRRGAPRRRSTA